MSNYQCAGCDEPMQVNEWAFKRGAPMTCGRCIPNLRAKIKALRAELAVLRAPAPAAYSDPERSENP